MSSLSLETPENASAPTEIPPAEASKTASSVKLPSVPPTPAMASPNPWAQDLSFGKLESTSVPSEYPPFVNSSGGSTASLPPSAPSSSSSVPSSERPIGAAGTTSGEPSFAKLPSSVGSAIDVKIVPSPAPSADSNRSADSTTARSTQGSLTVSGSPSGKDKDGRPRSASRSSMYSSSANVYSTPSTMAAAKGSFPLPRPVRGLFDWTLHLIGRSRTPAEQSQLIEQSVNATIKVWSQWRQFKSFVNQGRIVETSIAVVIGDSFKDVVRSFVNDMLLPPLQRITGGASFFTFFILKHGRTAGKVYNTLDEARADGAIVFSMWNFADKVFSFFVVGLAAYYMLRAFKHFFHRYIEPENRDCPECFSSIPKKATRCAYCTSHVEPQQVFYPRY